jgi:hypothetical protein
MMKMNPYEYEAPVPWIPQQDRAYPDGAAYTRQQAQSSRSQQRNGDQKLKPPGHMPKARALALARTFKKWLIAASLAGFIALSGLAASHQIGATASATRASTGSSQNAASTTSSSSQSNNSFFNQHEEGNHFGSSSSSQGSGDANSNGSGSSAQAPVTASNAS